MSPLNSPILFSVLCFHFYGLWKLWRFCFSFFCWHCFYVDLFLLGMYGEYFVVRQYLPHAAELLFSSQRKLSPSLEAGCMGCVSLLRHVLPSLKDSTLMEHLQVDSFLFISLLISILSTKCKSFHFVRIMPSWLIVWFVNSNTYYHLIFR